MTAESIVIAADHAGYPLKTRLARYLEGRGFQVIDLGAHSEDSVDYPDFGEALACAISAGRAARGVLVCGSGIGIAIAANRHRGVRAVNVYDEASARLSRQHNDANVASFGARLIDPATAERCLDVFLSTPFEGGRHARRVAKLA